MNRAAHDEKRLYHQRELTVWGNAAKRVAGVTHVHNHLEVTLPSGDYRDDAMLATAANNTLTLNITVPDGYEYRNPTIRYDGGIEVQALAPIKRDRDGFEYTLEPVLKIGSRYYKLEPADL